MRLCVIQARSRSTRLPGKMLLTLGNETLIARAWRIACEAFGASHCVVAIPWSDRKGALRDELDLIGARVYVPPFWVRERDVLRRFVWCAESYLSHDNDMVVRYTPDDPFKDPISLSLLTELPARDLGVYDIETSGEVFTLRWLRDMNGALTRDDPRREHIGHLLPPRRPPRPAAHPYTIDTQEDYERAVTSLA